MKTSLARRISMAAVIVTGALWIATGPSAARAQKSPAGGSTVNLLNPDMTSVDAERGALDRFLDAHPEIENDVVGRPSAMSDSGYLHEHPELQAFLESHPQVKADPRAFVSPGLWRDVTRRSDLDMMMGYLVPFAVFICFLLAALWVLRNLLESRRWNRSFKVHEEVHAKLIEKFASGQDLTAYMQSDAGRRLLEWTPPALDSATLGTSSTFSRILRSLQAGVVLLLVGIGMLLLRGQMAASDVLALPLLVFGTLGTTLGAGFVLSAFISYALSRRLGLIGAARLESDAILKR